MTVLGCGDHVGGSIQPEPTLTTVNCDEGGGDSARYGKGPAVRTTQRGASPRLDMLPRLASPKAYLVLTFGARINGAG